ncbi:MAG: fasciclin domain-containing protein [bacterium]
MIGMIYKIRNYSIFSLLILLLAFNSCNETSEVFLDEDEEQGTIAEHILASQDSFNIFLKILQQGDILQTLSARNPKGTDYTLFLPDDNAVNKYIESSPYQNLDELLADNDFVLELGKYHVVTSGFETNSFPFGALPDSTGTGDYLTIGFEEGTFIINNSATIIRPNQDFINGFIHVIDNVLQPVNFTSYQWVRDNPEFSIFTAALELTGLKDTLNNPANMHSLLVEPDSVMNKYNIHSVDDLIDRYSPTSSEYGDYENGLYQFVAYHILEYVYYINDFTGNNDLYNTYARFPARIDGTGLEIRINPGDTLIAGQDTSYHIEIDYENSNALAMNGSVHVLRDVMALYEPPKTTRKFEFYNEPIINQVKNESGNHVFIDPSDFTYLSWAGSESLTHYKSSTNLNGVDNDDYITVSGDFTISYVTPRLLPGEYIVLLNAHAKSSDNAVIQMFIDENRIGSNINLTVGATGPVSFNEFEIGIMEFEEDEPHVIRIKSLIPGEFRWDYIGFRPVN